MKRISLFAILIFWVAIFFHLIGNALEVSPTKPLQPSKPSIQPSPKPLQITILPDLIVERVWIDNHNRVAFILRNIGKGLIPEEVHGRGNVKVTYGEIYRDYPLKGLDPTKALTRPGGMVSFTSDIELGSPGKVTVEVDSTRQISESREDNNLLSAFLTPRVAISKEQKVTKPTEVVTKGDPLIKIVRIYQKEGKIHIVLKNEGHGKFSPRDYDQGKIAVRYGDKTLSFLLKNIDPEHRLDSIGGEVEFNTNIQIEAKPEEASLPINITLYDLKDIKVGSMEMVLPPSLPLEVAKPDFAWITVKTAEGSITPALINKGSRFVGRLNTNIFAYGFSNVKEMRPLIFTEQDPFDHGEIIPIPVDMKWDLNRSCSLLLYCEVKSGPNIEADETNNTAVIPVYPPPKYARFELMNERIELKSGQSLWTPRDWDTVKISDNVTVAKPDVVLMDVIFSVFNCSGETRILNPLISYLGPGGQKREQNIGSVQIRPGDHTRFETTIQLAIRFGNYDRDNFIILNLWDKKSIRVNIDFSSDQKFRAMLRGRCLDSIYYPERVELEFKSGKKMLYNGGTVTLQKGDWLNIDQNQYRINFVVWCRLKACVAHYTRLEFKMLSFGYEFNEHISITFPAEQEVTKTASMLMSPSPWDSVLKIIDEQTGKEIFKGIIKCSESLLNEVGWRPWLHLSSGPYVYLNHQKKEVNIKCFVENSGGPIRNKEWSLSLDVKKQNKLVHSKTWKFNSARSGESLECSFTFKPIYDEDHTYKVSLFSGNKNILTNKKEDLERTGSFYVPW